MVGTSLSILIQTELGQPGSLIGDDQIYKACPSESGTDKFMQRFI